MSHLRRLAAFALTFSVILLVAAALLMSAARFALPYVSEYRDALASTLSQRLGYRVSIGSLSMRLSGWEPRLSLARVSLADPETSVEVLSLKGMVLRIDPLASLRDGAPQFTSLTLVGARLAVRRLADGQLEIAGLGGLKSDNPRALELFLGQGRLRLTDTEVLFEDERIGKPVIRLADTDLTLHNEGPRHWINLSARPLPSGPAATAREPTASGAARSPRGEDRLSLIAELKGPPAEPRAWDGRVYIGLATRDASSLLPPALTDGYRLDGGRLLVEAWARLRAGRLQHALVQTDLTNLGLSTPGSGAKRASKSRPVRIRHLNATVRADATDAGWTARVANLQAAMGEAKLSGLDVELQLDRQAGLRGLGVAAPFVGLGDLAEVLAAASAPLPEVLTRVLDTRPQGQVRDLALRVELPPAGQPEARPRWGLSGEFQGLGWTHRGRLPGATGISGTLAVNQDRGDFQLDSRSAVLDLNPLFDKPIPVDALTAALSWARDSAGNWHFAARKVQARNADVSGGLDLAMHFPADGSSPVLDLDAAFGDGNAAHTRTYLPVGTMSPKLVAWLEQAIVSGRLTKGSASFHGRVVDYPFRDRQGSFELYLAFEDTLFNYERGWPVMQAAGGDLRFVNEGLTIRLDRGRIFDTAVSAGSAVIPDTKAARHMIIQAQADGPLADGLRVLAESPLSTRFGRLADALAVTGQSRLALSIDLPLHEGRELGLKGRLTWPGAATLGIEGTSVELSTLAGALEFTESSLAARALTARLWGRPVQVSIATQGESNPQTSTTLIEANSATEIGDLATRFPSGLWGPLTGRLDWTLAVTLKNREVTQERPTLGYRLVSDLRGVAVDLPAPLGKGAKARRHLELAGELVPGQAISVTGGLGDLGTNLQLDLGSATTGPRLVSGRVRLGGRAPPAPEGSGLVLDGFLDALDVAPWISWAEARDKTKMSRGAKESSGSTDNLSVDRFKIGRLGLGDLALTDVTLAAKPRIDGWDLHLDAREVAGFVHLRAKSSAEPPRLALDRLDLAPLLGQERPKPVKKRKSQTSGQLDRLPSLDLRVTDLRWGKTDLGTLDLALRRTESGLSMPHLTLDGRDERSIRGSGQWMKGPDGGRSRVELSASTSDLKNVFAGLEYKSALDASAAKADIKLQWAGGFDDFALKRTSGTIDLDIGEGRFLDMDPGLGRVLGFLNVGALGRRLALDFSDIYGRGFVFEQMKGRVTVGGGKATFDRFTIDGPAGKIGVAGTTDLVAQRFNQTVTVEPKIGSSVALASAVAGGPVVGAAVLLVDKVAGNPIDRLSRYRYKVTGPWGSPALRRVGWEPAMLEASAPTAGDRKTKPKGQPRSPVAESEKNLFLDLR